MPIHKLIWMMAMLILFPSGMVAQTKVPTTVSLQVTTPLTVPYGEAIDGLAQVTANDGATVTGTVTFYDGTRSFCTLTLANGASCPAGSAQNFVVGTHLFTAVYSGDTTHAGATSNAVTVMVEPDTTTTAVASSAPTVAIGGNVVYTATVVGAHGPVSGVVTFLDGTVAMGSTNLTSSGGASLSVLMLVAGQHAITARYEGNGNLQGSTSAVLPVNVEGTPAVTATTISASAGTVTLGQNVTFTAKVTATGAKAASSGAVTFVDNGMVVGTGAVQAGTSVWSTSSLDAGTHSIVARYWGDSMTSGSVSAPVHVVVKAQQDAPDGLTLGATTVTVAAGDTVSVPLVMQTSTGMAKAVSLSCSGLPEEASCSYVSGASGAAASQGTATLRIATSAPRDCGASTPYGAPAKSAGMPMAAPVLAGVLLLLVPRRRGAMKNLLAILCAVMVVGAMSGCGIGACTDLGTRPGTYTITVTGTAGGTQVSQKIKLVVTP